jgi:hypothetical protein
MRRVMPMGRKKPDNVCFTLFSSGATRQFEMKYTAQAMQQIPQIELRAPLLIPVKKESDPIEQRISIIPTAAKTSAHKTDDTVTGVVLGVPPSSAPLGMNKKTQRKIKRDMTDIAVATETIMDLLK